MSDLTSTGKFLPIFLISIAIVLLDADFLFAVKGPHEVENSPSISVSENKKDTSETRPSPNKTTKNDTATKATPSDTTTSTDTQPETTKKINTLLRSGVNELRKGDTKSAISRFKKALEVDSSTFKPYLHLTAVNLLERNDTRAEKYIGILKQKDQVNPFDYYYITLLVNQVKKLNQEIKTTRKSTRPDTTPDWMSSYVKGQEYRQLNNLKKAREHFLEAIKKQPEAILPLLELGKLEFNQEQFVEAKKQFEKVLRIRPNNQDARNHLNKIQEKLRKKEMARNKDTAEKTTNKPLEKIQQLINQQDYDRAKNELTDFVQSEPNNSQAHFLLGDILSKQNNYKEAYKHYRMVLKLEKNNKSARKNLQWLEGRMSWFDFFSIGKSYFNNGDYKKAEFYLQKSVNLNPSHRRSAVLLGKTREKLYQ